MKERLNQWKLDLAEKVSNFPVLQVMVLDFRFLIVASLVGLALLTGLIMLPKFWVVSPAGVLPVIRVSGLDLVQAKMLRRTGQRELEAGHLERAIWAWQSAFANNPGDPELTRGAIRVLLQVPQSAKYARPALKQSFWLLRLTQTNLADLEFVAEIFEKYDTPDLLFAACQSRFGELTPRLRTYYAKALFQAGAIPQFVDFLKGPLEENEDLKLYRAAYHAGWTSGPESEAAARLLAQTSSEGSNQASRFMAMRLQLQVAARRYDLEGYANLLKQLELGRADTFRQHLTHWNLLLKEGRRAEAAAMVRNHATPPDSFNDFLALIALAERLEMRDYALQLCRKLTADFEEVAVFWKTYIDQLIDAGLWDQLPQVLARIRSTPVVRDQLRGFGFLTESRAETQLGHRDRADQLAAQAASCEYPDPGEGLEVARGLLASGQSRAALELLTRLEEPLRPHADYWVSRMRAAELSRDSRQLLLASQNAYRLDTNDARIARYYLAASLLNQTNRSDVSRLSLMMLLNNPDQPQVRINRAASLLLDHREKESLELLQSVDPRLLDPSDVSFYHFDLLETQLANQLTNAARQTALAIDERLLFDIQRDRLKAIRREFAGARK